MIEAVAEESAIIHYVCKLGLILPGKVKEKRYINLIHMTNTLGVQVLYATIGRSKVPYRLGTQVMFDIMAMLTSIASSPG